ncbi:Shikimate O-hydroxycinnamoyltransferase [Apostasia shenzhenica]|uniref:Shikimate O-hydroxycinnamoyltransferase n=1 Tax=Apostasia shenzhenica TaxID=1088818 RepID=A0A2I0A9L9_9ASPA|nr:Shikimate O-hydroxycinnamoyltransferase [Apostasia shenzhenica]
MVYDTDTAGGAVHGYRLSTVVPGSVTHENAVHELAGADLAMKLHYLRTVYYFAASETVEGLTTKLLKDPTFPLLDIYYPVAGRIRRDDGGRPYIKCNDGGVRIVEASCDSTFREWLESTPAINRHSRLVSDGVVGPDLHFSPTVFLQFTRFKCGGMSVGFSWAHLLGDAVSATEFLNLWGQLLTGKELHKSYELRGIQNQSEKIAKAIPDSALPLSVKQVKQVGDLWLNPNSQRMSTLFIEVPAAKLKELKSNMPTSISIFEILSAILWKSIAELRADKEPKTVTICRNSSIERSGIILSNEETLNTLLINSSPAKAKLLELASLINEKAVNEMKTVEHLVKREGEKLDIVVYGANLTFIDAERVDFYDMEIKGEKPVHVECSIDGVGDEGAIMVLRGPSGIKFEGNGINGRLLSIILPENEISQLRDLLANEWGIA